MSIRQPSVPSPPSSPDPAGEVSVSSAAAAQVAADGSASSVSSRQRFSQHRRKVKLRQLPGGSVHSVGVARSAKERVRSSGTLIREFLSLLRPYRGSLVLALVTVSISTLLGLIPPAGTKFVIDYALNGRPLPLPLRSISLLGTPVRLLGAVVIVVTAVSLLKIVIHIWGRWHATRISKIIQLDIRRRVFEHAVRLPLHRVQELRSGGVASILREDGGSVGELVFGLLYNPWRAVIQLAGSFAVLAWVDWTLLLGAVVLLPTVFVTHRAWINSIRPQFRAIRKQREQIDAGAAESFAGIRIVRAFSRQRREAWRFSLENNMMARQELYAWWWMRIVEIVWEALIPIASAGLLFYGGWRVTTGVMTAGDLMMFLVYLVMLLEPLAALATSATQFQNSLSGLDRVLDMLAEPQEMPSGASSLRVNRQAVRGDITFQGVRFLYPGTDQAALSDINLRVAAGQTVALVGPSGAGKTTLCNLVARFYDPTEGCVLLDDQDLRQFDVESYRSLLGVVEQDVFLFDGTIAANISYGCRHATEQQILDAAEAANALEFIQRMPLGLQTVIGERGVRLSGGQRQRLAIARAILADPRLLILDEATSNLDTDSEQLIQQSLGRLMRGRTCFVIAHRLSTIASADVICVVEAGRILQTGTHAELMSSGGRYRAMVEQQVRIALGGVEAPRPAASHGRHSKADH
ncbi:MAG TPA: ABC transporter ATP-binding protein [Planctomycetaceae bacterium]|nr:ABC transporter ATP-binding protein [Planctomycetaceae bacterium]